MSDRVTEQVRVLAGRYRLGALLGRGGMAEVYSAQDARLGREVAVKLLRPSLANDPAFRTRFRQEAQAAAKMAHPTIVRVFDAGEETVTDPSGVELQIPFIVMEKVEGTLLRDLIDQGPLTPQQTVHVMDGVLTALEYSHRAGVVHRDIKPGNIMLTSSGQVKVMDFGIARAISESQATIAQTSAILGTAQYFSPEQARGESVDARTDLYSAGVVLYEMLTGRPPFSADTAVAVAYRHISEPPTPPAELESSISPAMNAVALRALAKDRFERYQTAAEFRDELDTAAEGRLPVRDVSRDDEFNATLFGVNPTSGAASQETLRRLTTTDDDRALRSTQSRPPAAWIWGGVVVMAMVLVAVTVWVFSLQAGTGLIGQASVRVPDLGGQSWQRAQSNLKKLDLAATRVDRASGSVAQGNVIETTPGPDQTVARGYTVTVYVSSGPQKVSVPSVVTLTQADATTAIQQAGLVVGKVTQQDSPTAAQGIVLSSDPNSDSDEVAAGTKVDLVVSTGKVDVPSVVGQDVQDANDALTGPDLQLGTKLVADKSCSGQKVTQQSATGEQPQGTVVSLTYCSGS